MWGIAPGVFISDRFLSCLFIQSCHLVDWLTKVEGGWVLFFESSVIGPYITLILISYLLRYLLDLDSYSVKFLM